MPAKSFKFICLPVLRWPNKWVSGMIFDPWDDPLRPLTEGHGLNSQATNSNTVQCGVCYNKYKYKINCYGSREETMVSSSWGYFTWSQKKMTYELCFCFETSIYCGLTVLTLGTHCHIWSKGGYSRGRKAQVKAGGFQCVENDILGGMLQKFFISFEAALGHSAASGGYVGRAYTGRRQWAEGRTLGGGHRAEERNPFKMTEKEQSARIEGKPEDSLAKLASIERLQRERWP